MTILLSVLMYVLTIGGFLLGIVLIAHILLQKRSPSGTIAWLLIILLAPYVGVPLYLLLGGRKMRRQAASKHLLALGDEHAIAEDKAHILDRILRTYSIPGASAGHTVCLCGNGVQRFTAMDALIRGAVSTIFLETFIYHSDEVGVHFLNLLTEKARSGVNVRLLIDGVGSLHTPFRFFKGLTDAGGRVTVFMPVLHRPFRGRANLRNHRKITIIDNRYVMAGGANIGKAYMGPHRYEKRWKDLAFVLEGPSVRQWLNVFAGDWEFAAKEPIPSEWMRLPDSPASDDSPMANLVCRPSAGPMNSPGSAVVQMVPSGPDVASDALNDIILSMIYAAKRRFWVVTPYFVPDDAMCKALVLAARRKVDVRVILPENSNHPLPDIVRGQPLRQIQQAGGLIMFYTPSMMHAKLLLMDDDAAILGSANLDVRSLLLNYETAMIVYSREDILAVAEYIESLIPHCKCGVAGASLPRALGESVVRLVAPLL
ncbi:MAG: phospholipase D-like domain-containing protein [Planctomycetaceae bacterium]|nr:phospholipase D-like domain-containing protein [Planctomycetaceae bacterium]